MKPSLHAGRKVFQILPYSGDIFLEVPENKLEFQSERIMLQKTVMEINSDLEGAFVASSGKNMALSRV